ncbi:hypothetical protein ASPNIDRAFT_38486 [Aspergillus niger ATCC 1015]|uniref:Uncharacterized protein n=1 Tax=Aspergillus niger (strain ATCC 1015 / CBS 113.46 / FGSC A1144 / LSHB Ac4 / NCTC 3858a / NRRL 328 / USDA 3528.7) TaxID=380704 RepID=G3YGB0_ASPNA|nr:uncharacterized protein BO96DRAFT_432213 [Aspergillus niger CBS 101883]EHA17909.1 hypothetical protein ASPNIDRAFT_38486 [Aspergillus niger ATCC 1015]PYH59132.1 hypothetical protein BO96DRAFT_432213 [Aspergillus niger CBS 101883]
MGRDWRRQPARQEGVEGAALIGDRRPELAGGGFGLDTFGIRAVFAPYRQFGRTPRVPQRFGLSCTYPSSTRLVSGNQTVTRYGIRHPRHRPPKNIGRRSGFPGASARAVLGGGGLGSHTLGGLLMVLEPDQGR